jgi:hypothetical protein
MYPCVVHEQSPSEYLTKVQTSSLLKENSDSLLNPAFPKPVGTGPVQPVPGPTGPARFEK